jgi:uncharacterized SAM-binding protein YcdF (DUF218 family)
MEKSTGRVFVIFFSVLIVITILFLLEGEDFLCVKDDNPSLNTDAVIVLAGPPGEDNLRIQEGFDLFRQGRGRYLILPLRHKSFSWSWVLKNYQIEDTIPEDKILIGKSVAKESQIKAKSSGTFMEAKNAVEIMHRLQLNSAIIVSSCYHMRRVKIAFEKVRLDQYPQFYYYPVQIIDKSDEFWWLNKKYLQKVLKEYKKLIAAYFIY